ncbi:MAG: hypothetical protein HC914_16300 [Chloroflexaceae bacterium]|nr:hypothetical protein [Chloroflexaceae bacterium]
MTLNPTIKHISNHLLTFIEQREGEQIDYGIYDVTMTGAEVLASFPLPAMDLPPETGRDAAIRAALQHLADEIQIIRFTDAEQPDNWVFRSRMAEIVRLLSKLKQRIVQFNNQKARHRVSSGKRLVADIKYSVQPRQVPRRDIPAQSCLKLLSGGHLSSSVLRPFCWKSSSTNCPSFRR